MVALVAALGLFHLAQQRVHFIEVQAPVGAHRAVAGHGGQQLVVGALHYGAGVHLFEFGQHAARQLDRVALRQRGGHGAHCQRAWRKSADLQPQRLQGFGVGLCRSGFGVGAGKRGGYQQGLAGQAAGVLAVFGARPLVFEPLVDDALVGGVHVHHHQALGVFGQYINALQLRQRAAQRPVALGQSGGWAGSKGVFLAKRQRYCAHGRLPQRGHIAHTVARQRLLHMKGHGALAGIQDAGRLRRRGLQRVGPARGKGARFKGAVAALGMRRVGALRLRTRRSQCVFGGVAHRLVYFAAVTKAHFDLGGVHVHVHPRRVHVQVQRIDGLALAVQHVFIGAAGGVGEHLVAHKAAVYIAKLLVGPGARGVGNTHAAPHPHLAPGCARTIGPLAGAAPVHGNRARQKVGTQHVGQAPV